MMLPVTQLLGDIPQDDAGTDRNIKGVFGAILWNFDGAVTTVDHLLMDSFHFIPENEGDFHRLQGQTPEGECFFHLFHGIDAVS